MDIHSDLVISRSDGRPMYLQIMEQIKHRIAVGDWKAGDEIPSIRQMAIALRVSLITIKRAYLELEREGVIATQHGKGSTVGPAPDLRPRLSDQELEHHISEAARLGTFLGIEPEKLGSRLREAAVKLKEGLHD